jgi:hypothetical protein
VSTTPEQLAEETAALLRLHPDLERFVVSVADADTTPEDVVTDSLASAKKGRIVVIPESEVPEELGILAGGSAYLYTVTQRLVLVDGRKNATLNAAARQAVKVALRNVLLPSASGRIEFVESWRRAGGLGPDTVRAWEMALTAHYDDILDTVGYTAPSGAGDNLLLETGDALLLETGDLLLLDAA